MDGPRVDGNTGFAVCIFRNQKLFKTNCYQLNSYNSVFQAELAAINFAAGCALERGAKIKIVTGSLSSIESLKSFNNRSNFVLNIKKSVINARGKVCSSWVEAHAGVPEKELADQFAKTAAFTGQKNDVPEPYSFLKYKIKEFIIKNWE
ncbi:hypothetical protein AVEN_92940-1 [Araneus ventricosus]|uniref:RNase H type-1 domain-containing protein n=1 Tax=Araneus ventricosus TaxID=182803 RepID=A0A4Y2NBA2_ARAVE|nr:hypothetical protein AVEN_92940-1 [Araneus ventricosus]